jgi:hypothetical protein
LRAGATFLVFIAGTALNTITMSAILKITVIAIFISGFTALRYILLQTNMQITAMAALTKYSNTA